MIGFFSPSPGEMMIVGVIALLLFGKRLPDVAKSLGKGMREFKEGMAGIQNEFHGVSSAPSRSESRPAARPVPTDEDDAAEFVAPKFEPPPVEPVETNRAV